MQAVGEFDYIFLSDVHLGSDIVTHARPWAATSWLQREAEVDDQLVSLFDYHRQHCAPGRKLCVVTAGDFLDLVGISLSPSEQIRTAPTSEEQRCGLGSAPDHVVHKVHAIARRHPRVLRALCALLLEGHRLVLVRGNHDIELHWQAAQQAFKECVVASAPEGERERLCRQIAIQPWFFAVDGLLYVEHGHNFDAMCSYGDPLLPTCPEDPRRIQRVPFSVMLRNVARPTRGLSTSRYEHSSFGAYFGLMAALGLTGTVCIAWRFGLATAHLIDTWLQHVRGDCDRRRHQKQARKLRFSLRESVPAERLSQLEALYVRPASHSLGFVLRSLYLDRVAALIAAIACVIGGAMLTQGHGTPAGVLCALPALLLAIYAVFGVDRGIKPAQGMQRGAVKIAAMFNARWVVMGHTHHAKLLPLDNGATYVNLGHWGEDDLPEERAASATTSCTYFHVRMEDDEYRGSLMRWDAQRGPSPAQLPAEAGDRPKNKSGRLLGGLPKAHA